MLEKMDDFFAARVDGYDEHMINDVGGCRECYEKMAEGVKILGAKNILDLGCGTGLELDFIYKLCPGIEVTGIDLTREMLERLGKKHPDKKLHLINGDYFKEDFGKNFDAAISFQTLHHFTREKKLGLYKKLRDALAPGGVYIECDYMCETDEQEIWMLGELAKNGGEGSDGKFHFDIPITVSGQLALLKIAGFSNVEEVFRVENTVMLVAKK